MFPLEKLAYEGRANYKGILHLYLGTSKDISISEIRPWPGKYVSLGCFVVRQDLTLVDFTIGEKNNFYIDFDNNKILAKDDIGSLWGELNEAFSLPVFQTDTSAEYIVTQLVSELPNSNDFNGIRDKRALVYFFDIIESNNINLNTRIAYKNLFYGYEKDLEFRDLESKSNKIKYVRLSNIIL